MTVIGLILQDGEELGVKAVSGFERRLGFVAVRDRMDPYAPDAARRGLYHLENGAVVGGELLARLGDGLRERHAKAGNGRTILSDGEVEVEVAVDLADGGPALNQNRSSRFAREELLGDVVLAHDVADQL